MKRRAFVRLGAQLAGGVVALPLLPGCGGGDPKTAASGELFRTTNEALAAQAPAQRTYSAASGATIYGGLFSNPLLSMVAAAPENSWIQLNLNAVQTVWPGEDYKPIYTAQSTGSTTAVIRCWSSFSWDATRSRMILYGGGHANYDGNEVYVFNGSSRQWMLGFWPSDDKVYNESTAERVTVDGPLNSPVSAHTYDNTAYLEILDRYITFGGAAAHTGGPYAIHGDGPDRSAGPYMLDLTLAGQGLLGGLTGSNVHRGSTLNVNLSGANAWSVRDYYKDHADPAGALPFMTSHISCGTAYTQENGHDVIYMTTRPGYHLHRIEFVDSNYRNDIITRVGSATNNPPDWDATVALDPVKRIVLILGHDSARMFWGWDISGASMPNFLVPASGLTGPGAAAWIATFASQHGIEFDPVNNRFVMWSEGGQIFGIQHQGGSLSSNWYVEELRTNSGSAGVDRPKTRTELDAETSGVYSKSDFSVNGKWKWAKELNAFVGLQHTYNGNVWIYKPSNWVSPPDRLA